MNPMAERKPQSQRNARRGVVATEIGRFMCDIEENELALNGANRISVSGSLQSLRGNVFRENRRKDLDRVTQGRRGRFGVFGPLLNSDVDSCGDEFCEADGIPVGKTHAPMAGGATDGVRLIGAVNANAGFTQGAPSDTDRIVRPGREEEELVGAHAVVEDALVPAEVGEERDGDDAPVSRGGR